MKQRAWILVVLLLFMVITPVHAQSARDADMPTLSEFKGYVYDDVGILSEDDIRYINATNNDLYNKTGGQVFVVLLHTTGGVDHRSYVTELFNRIHAGDADKDNGTVFLAAIDDRRMELESGYGTDDFIPDIYALEILDVAAEYFPSDTTMDVEGYRQGILEAFNHTLSFYAEEYDITIEQARDPERELQRTRDDSFDFAFIFRLILIILLLSTVFGGRGGSGRRRRTIFFPPFGPFGGGFGGGFGGFGGFGGSSGGGFGGGFGGGGSSGGGGAGRGW
ncbi:TPM domain-containing protein [Peptoniphilus equinus]|uniref:TPM domain-containing protein n=1 Tax=Peptoniphilus equinus TaxID=3016343 RepID=A0ABY7QSG0_9FIRM|nr:TPM domain-containing protein [Peptoniphilus equinus]WBW49732.1 TPM domain-containing protein [Peptoniphilus equinus]